MIVVKVGGALLPDAAGVRRACDLLLDLPPRALLVVSAMRGATRALEAIARTAAGDPAGAAELVTALVDHHHDVARELLTPHGLESWRTLCAPELTRLDEVVRGLGIVGELSPRTLDLVEHVGERLASTLVATVLRERGRAVDQVSALEVIITDSAHRYARPDMALTARRAADHLLPLLSAGGTVVTEGYIARAVDGSVTTMGRESSDYSATLLGALLDADEVRIYTTVEGVMTADPAVAPDARTIERMSYAMANAMAEAGAQLLHPRTVLPVWERGIPLSIRSLDNRGTTIATAGDPDARSVALNPHAELLLIESRASGTPLGPLLAALSSRAPLAWHHRYRRRSQIILARPWPDPALPLDTVAEGAVLLDRRPVALVSIVCECTPPARTLGAMIVALEDAGIAVHASQSAIDGHAVGVAVDRERGEDAVRLVHGGGW